MAEINYINHHKNVNAKMISEKDISSIDISIYNALFLLWNANGFCKMLSINRSEVMQLSKVGNANTYTKSLKKLHDLKYIVYYPSNNPLVGSKISFIRFDKGGGKSSDISGGNSTDTSSDISSGLSSDTSSDTLYKHYNTITHKHIKTLLTLFSDVDESDFDFYFKQIEKLKKEKSSAKKEKIIEVEIYPTFDDFWEEYDKKVGDKDKIKLKWNKLSQETKEKIMEYIPNYKASQPDKKFRKNPDTFLNNKSWNDELIIPNNYEKSTQQPIRSQSEVFIDTANSESARNFKFS